MGLLEQCQELFNTSNLYEVLGSSKEATEEQLKRSYYKMSLKVHPDRAPDDPQATEKFQVCLQLTASNSPPPRSRRTRLIVTCLSLILCHNTT